MDSLIDRLATVHSEFLRENPDVGPIILREIAKPDSEGFQIVIKEIVPMFETMERSLVEKAEGRLRDPGFLRETILQVIVSQLVRGCLRDSATQLWPENDHSVTLARSLVFRDTGVSTAPAL